MVSCGTLSVEQTQPDVDPDLVGIAGCNFNPSDIAADGLVDVVVSWENGNGVQVEIEYTITVGGATIESGTKVLGSQFGGQTQVSFVPMDFGLVGGDFPVDVTFSVLGSASAPVLGGLFSPPRLRRPAGCGCQH